MRVIVPRRPGVLAAVAVFTAVLLVAATAAVLLMSTDTKQVTAYFTTVKGLYEGDDVRILGVPVGTVSEIEPEPMRVRVEVSYDASHKVPADAKAAIVAPSLVTVRHVALAPAYNGGPVLDDGAVIPLSRTAVPVEFDEMKKQVHQLIQALGPQGANANGELNRLLNTTAANFAGNGDDLRRTLHALSEAAATLAANRGDVFATVRNLQVFVEALARSDGQVAEFNRRLARVSDLLADDRAELGVALDGLNRAFSDVTRFLRQNRDALRGTVADLRPTADLLADLRQKLADVLHGVPHVLSNLYAAYDPIDGSLTATLVPANLQAPAVFACSVVYSLGGTPQMCQAALAPLARLALPPMPGGASPVVNTCRENQVISVPGPDNPAYSCGPPPSDRNDPTPSRVVGLPRLLLPGGQR